MSDVPWTITKSKRTRSARPSTSRKRVRLSSEHSDRHETKQRNEQQTLTQIAFVEDLSFKKDDSPLGSSPSPKANVTQPASILKRDSTLTQMDFLEDLSPTRRRKTVHDELKMPPPSRKSRRKTRKRDSTLTQMDFFNANAGDTNDIDEAMLPDTGADTASAAQTTIFDGPYSDQPHATPRSGKSGTGHEQAQETQEYRPRGNKRKQNDDQPDTKKRRRSDRIAAATSPRLDRMSTIMNSRSGVITESRRRPASTPRRPLLEIRDSTDFLEEAVNQTPIPHTPETVQPFTPIRSSKKIPSSQTPESIHRPTTQQAVTPSRKPTRGPLAELSANVRRSGRKPYNLRSRSTEKPSKPILRKSPPRKVCVLKLPKAVLGSLARGGRAEDLGNDVNSLQTTSSPVRMEHKSKNALPKDPSNGSSSPMTNPSSDGPTIKETASSQLDLDTQKSLPELSDVFGISDVSATDGTRELPVTMLPQTRFGDADENDEMLLDLEKGDVIPESEQASSDTLSDLGSPIANDTQFVRNLNERLSSPAPTQKAGMATGRAATAPVSRALAPPSAKRFSRTRLFNPPSRKSPLPAPKLVSTSPARKSVQGKGTNSSVRALHSFSTQNKSLENVKISFLPLNDTVEHQHKPSSPSLPTAPVAVQEAQLASIPRPSQISTQAPSQGYFPLSSLPQTFAGQQDSGVEGVIIKDSSSAPTRMSQMVAHHIESDDLGPEGDLDLLEDIREDEDLDPLTTQADISQVTPRRRRNAKTVELDDVTQTPTQRYKRDRTVIQAQSSPDSSPIILAATTRSQRDAKLEVVTLSSSSSPPRPKEKDSANPPNRGSPTTSQRPSTINKAPRSRQSSSPSPSVSSLYSPSPPRDLKRKYDPIPGFDNDTQSDFTQGGHVTAAYVHRMWDRGDLPREFVPKPYKVKNFKPSMRSGSGAGSKGKGKSVT